MYWYIWCSLTHTKRFSQTGLIICPQTVLFTLIIYPFTISSFLPMHINQCIVFTIYFELIGEKLVKFGPVMIWWWARQVIANNSLWKFWFSIKFSWKHWSTDQLAADQTADLSLTNCTEQRPIHQQPIKN